MDPSFLLVFVPMTFHIGDTDCFLLWRGNTMIFNFGFIQSSAKEAALETEILHRNQRRCLFSWHGERGVTYNWSEP
jgi:hypothetical protein